MVAAGNQEGLSCPMLPLGVVIPTKNSLRYLPGHLENLATWIDLAEHVVVVDSFSTDGTMDYLNKNLRHPHIRIVEHPPGLYASWNFGISQITSEFCYISTVGDSITRAGITHLADTARRLKCDVLVSRPDFVNEAGRPCAGPEWPMDDTIAALNVKEPCCLSAAVMVATALKHTGGAITGSCASDLFRTSVLQKYPFPTDRGVAGDGSWSLQNAGRIQWAVTLEKSSTFRHHPTAASIQEVQAGNNNDRFVPMATDMVAGWLENCLENVPDAVRANVKQLLAVSIEHEEFRRRYNVLRKKRWPWFLNPAAWQIRSTRNQQKSIVQRLTHQICKIAG
jgi:Glycosyl transferase family 2